LISTFFLRTFLLLMHEVNERRPDALTQVVDERRPDSRVSVMTAATAVTFPSCSSAGGVFEISLKLLATCSVSVVVVVLIGPEGVSAK